MNGLANGNPIAGISNDKLKTILQAGAFGVLVLVVFVDLWRTSILLERIADGAQADNRRTLELIDVITTIVERRQAYNCSTPRKVPGQSSVIRKVPTVAVGANGAPTISNAEITERFGPFVTSLEP